MLGICRGCQLRNVYFGGTLIQDIPSQWLGAILHNDTERYDSLVHEVHFLPGSLLEPITSLPSSRPLSSRANDANSDASLSRPFARSSS